MLTHCGWAPVRHAASAAPSGRRASRALASAAAQRCACCRDRARDSSMGRAPHCSGRSCTASRLRLGSAAPATAVVTTPATAAVTAPATAACGLSRSRLRMMRGRQPVPGTGEIGGGMAGGCDHSSSLAASSAINIDSAGCVLSLPGEGLHPYEPACVSYSQPTQLHRTASDPSRPIPTHPDPSHPIPSHFVPSHLIPSHPVPSHPASPHPISYAGAPDQHFHPDGTAEGLINAFIALVPVRPLARQTALFGALQSWFIGLRRTTRMRRIVFASPRLHPIPSHLSHPVPPNPDRIPVQFQSSPSPIPIASHRIPSQSRHPISFLDWQVTHANGPTELRPGSHVWTQTAFGPEPRWREGR